MKHALILGAAVASASLLSTMPRAQVIDCAAEVPAVRSGHWYYRIIDGRKCWYQGKAMLPKSALRWARSSASETDAPAHELQAAEPATDGRNSAGPAIEPSAWPAPVANEGISFESRWLGLRSGN
jgi:hypothetical protein